MDLTIMRCPGVLFQGAGRLQQAGAAQCGGTGARRHLRISGESRAGRGTGSAHPGEHAFSRACQHPLLVDFCACMDSAILA